jgi:signal peptidase I
MTSMLKKVGQFFLDTIQAIVMALSIFIIVYLFLFQPHQVKGSSMMTSFEDGEFLLTDKISYRFNLPKRGDVIVFKAPQTEPCSEIECEYIKRIIGLPGDQVMVSKGKVYVNGQVLAESYLSPGTNTLPGTEMTEGNAIYVPDGYYLPMGDNRSHSRDGREFGPIPKESIVGKAMLRYWPIERIGLVKHPSF